MGATGVYLMNYQPPAVVLDSKPLDTSTRHAVTKEMQAAADKLSKTPLPKFSLKDLDGLSVSEAQFRRQKPTILVFIKNSCPCSIDAQPIFNAMAVAYGADAQFFGVINGPLRDAQGYASYNRVPFPMILDERYELIQKFNIEASASLALVDGNGQIRQVWPGYSKSVLRQVNFLLGAMAGTGPKEYDDSVAPEKLTAGCAFDFPRA